MLDIYEYAKIPEYTFKFKVSELIFCNIYYLKGLKISIRFKNFNNLY